MPLKKSHKITLSVLGTVVILVAGIVSFAVYQHRQDLEKANRDFEAYEPPQITDFGQTKRLSILPLTNWHKAGPSLKTEMGVSYLVKSDSVTILFDLSHNADETDPSPLEHNMNELGIGLDEIDIIFISHNHFDHVGGQQWVDEGSFSLGNEQIALVGKKVFTPVPMTYPGIQPVHTPDPTQLAEGVASIGTIPRKLFIGRIDEQALAVNVQGKGLVLIVGCGHQKLPRIIERTKAVFEEPIYGIIGDLHYPVPEGRINLLGLNAQRILASGEGPFSPLTQEEIMNNINLLTSLDLGIIGVGGHDSSDEVIRKFSETFGSNYRHVQVGKWIEAGTEPE